MVYKRRRVGTNLEQLENERVARDYATSIKFNQVIQAQKERISKQLASSEEGDQ